MRILVLTQMYPPHSIGGYGALCRDVVERWVQRGHEVEVLTTTFRVDGAGVEGSVPVRRELGFYWENNRLQRPSFWSRTRIERANQSALRRALRDVSPEVVSVWHMGAMSMSLLQTTSERNVPIVLVLGDDWLVYGQAVDPWTNGFVGRPRLRRMVSRFTGVPTRFDPPADALTACFASQWLRDRALARSPWPLARTAVVPHGVDPAAFAPRANDRPWGWRLLYAGRVEERKGVHVAVQAMAHLPGEASLEIVGPADDDYARCVRQRSDERVSFIGPVPRSTVADRLSDADAFVFPVVWDEPFGLAPLEAMAAGIPVVATGTGGSAEYLTDERNCLLVPRGDAPALAAAVTRLADDEPLRRRLIDAGRATANTYTVDQLAIGLESWHLAAAIRFRDGVPGAQTASASEPGRDA